MKKITKKNSLFALAAISALTLGFSVSTLNAQALEGELTTIAMVPGASVRLGATDDVNTYTGIRFMAELNNYSEENEYSYGMLIIPFDYTTTYADAIASFGGDYLMAAQASGIELVDLKCLPVFGDGDMDGNEEWYIQGSLVDLQPTNLNRKFVGIGYFYDGEVYTYAQVNEEENARSISFVASKVIHGYTNDVESENDPYDVCLDYVYDGLELAHEVQDFTLTADDSVALFKGASKKLTVAQAPEMNFFVKYESANEAIATVSEDGTVTAVGAGETTILVKCVDKVVEVPVTVSYDWANINYDFSSATDVDVSAASAVNTATAPAIVEATGASDGMAVYSKISGNGGLKISFNNIDVSKYSKILVRVKTTQNVNLNINDTYCDWPKYADFTEVNLITYMTSKGLTTLSSVSFTRNVNYEIWVDSVTFEELPDYTKYNYDFSSASDIDLEMVSVTNVGAVNFAGIVADAAASDGFALKLTKTSAAREGVIITFGNLDTSLYSKITLRIRTEANVGGVYVNSKSENCAFWNQAAAYTDVNILSQAGATLSYIFVGIDRNSTVIYVDSITFTEKKSYDYDFSSADDIDLEVVSITNAGAINFAGIVADATATDGFALKFTKTSAAMEGIIINLGNFDTSLYASVTLRIRTEGNVGGVYLDGKGGKCPFWEQSNTYKDVDLLKHAGATLSSIFVGIDRNSTVFYIDCITFVLK